MISDLLRELPPWEQIQYLRAPLESAFTNIADSGIPTIGANPHRFAVIASNNVAGQIATISTQQNPSANSGLLISNTVPLLITCWDYPGFPQRDLFLFVPNTAHVVVIQFFADKWPARRVKQSRRRGQLPLLLDRPRPSQYLQEYVTKFARLMQNLRHGSNNVYSAE